MPGWPEENRCLGHCLVLRPDLGKQGREGGMGGVRVEGGGGVGRGAKGRV